MNLFDNLHTGIYSLNSNVSSYFNTFQNSRPHFISPIQNNGAGIKAVDNMQNSANYNSYLNLVAPINPTLNFNSFYDCHTGVLTENLFQVNVQYAEFRSTQSKLATPTSTSVGQCGVWIKSNKFKNYAINKNKFLNIRTGVMLNSLHGIYNISGGFVFGQIWGTVNIKNNYFSPANTSTSAVGNQYMNNGVYADAPIFVSTSTISPANGLWIQNNEMDRVYRGVHIKNFTKLSLGEYTANNKILISQDHVSAVAMWGVRYENCKYGVVNSNTVTGFTTNTSTPLAGIYFSQCTNNSAKCNSVVTLPKGFEFANSNSGMIWYANSMQNNTRGMQLTSNGIISQQGNFSNPRDNFWVGSPWTGTKNATYTDGTSNATSSKMHVRSITGYTPTNNGGLPVGWSYASTSPSNVIQANNSAPYPPCVPSLPSKGPNYSKSPLANAIANNASIFQGNFIKETSEIYKILLYEDLAEDTALLNSDPVLQSFYSASTNSEIGALFQIETFLGQGNLSNANSQLAAFLPSSLIQSYYKRYYEIYSSYSNPNLGLTALDKFDLNDLAHKCPFVHGPIVYKARALNFLITENLEIYNDAACEDLYIDQLTYGEGGGELGRQFNKPYNSEINESQYNASYQLYPNPATDKLFIVSSNETEELQIEISDVSSKLILKTYVKINGYQGELKLDLLNGIYLVTLVNKENLKTNLKLIIAK
jgi:hypothetical protein